MFETETMAELCVKQGLVTEALAIYRRLVAAADDAAARERLTARLGAVERMAGSAARSRSATPATPEPAGAGEPTLTLERRDETLTFRWALPAGTRAPALQVLLLTRGAEGVEAETRTLPLEAATGTLTLVVPALHSVRGAIGCLDGPRFVPLARLTF